jgi:hypothetical protein
MFEQLLCRFDLHRTYYCCVMCQVQALELMIESFGMKSIPENGHHEIHTINMGFNMDLME